MMKHINEKKKLRRQEKFLGGPRNLFPQPENTGLTKEPPELSEKKKPVKGSCELSQQKYMILPISTRKA